MRRGDERGVMLMHAIVVMGLVTLAVGLVAGALGARAAAIRAETLAVQARYAAESGVASALAALRDGDPLRAPHRGSIAGCSFETIARARSTTAGLELVSTATCGERRITVARAVRIPPAS